MTLYVRIEKVASIEVKDGMTYEEAIAYGGSMESEGNLEYDLYLDVIDDCGEVVNEAGWDELEEESE